MTTYYESPYLRPVYRSQNNRKKKKKYQTPLCPYLGIEGHVLVQCNTIEINIDPPFILRRRSIIILVHVQSRDTCTIHTIRKPKKESNPLDV